MTIPIKIISAKELDEKPNQEEVWDKIAAPWKTYVVKKIPIVVEFLENKNGRILDLGCGNGRNMIPIKGISYYGVDFSKGQLEHAKKAIKRDKLDAKLFQSKIDKLPKEFENEMFDYGLFMASLHCLESEKEREQALKEFYRILKPNAEALISVWNAEDKRFNGLRGGIYLSWKEDNIPYMRYYYLYDKQEFIQLLESVGFKILEVYDKREGDRFSKKNFVVRVER